MRFEYRSSALVDATGLTAFDTIVVCLVDMSPG